LLLGLILVIWGPLLLFVLSSSFTAPVPNPIIAAEISLKITVTSPSLGAPLLFPLFSAQQQQLSQEYDCSNVPSMDEQLVRDWELASVKDLLADQCRNSNAKPTIQLVSFPKDAFLVWGVAPPHRDLLVQYLEGVNNTAVKMGLTLSFHRNSTNVNAEGGYIASVTTTAESLLLASDRTKFARMINSTYNASYYAPAPDTSVTMNMAVPPALVLGGTTLQPVKTSRPQLGSVCVEEGEAGCLRWQQAPRPVTLMLKSSYTSPQQWFSLCAGLVDGAHDCHGVGVVTVSSPLAFGLFAVLGLTLTTVYATFVLFVSNSLRAFTSGIVSRIITEEIPSCEFLWQLCLDILAARHDSELALEESLFKELIEIYRSPETLLEVTAKDKEKAE